MNRLKSLIPCLLASALFLSLPPLRADDGYRLWLRFDLIPDAALRRSYAASLSEIVSPASSPTLDAARDELEAGLRGLLGADVPVVASADRDNALLLGTPSGNRAIAGLGLDAELGRAGGEGYVLRRIRTGSRSGLVVAGNSERGVLYGAFALLRLIQTGEPLADLNCVSAPRIARRMLDHWDNLDGTVERGYAGSSLWDWSTLPDCLGPRYRDYARANASVGINGAVLTNVNGNTPLLTTAYLRRVAALADVFRPYGIRVYLPARFSAPIELGGLATADPLDPAVIGWWRAKCDEIYRLIPDFGGFLVKANSEGQPGPKTYRRTHADGANLLADALAPHGGIVMWRAFVYGQVAEDRARQAYDEFKPLDGKFRPNVLVQIKNGPIDFQPREPFHPLFGAMPHTPLALEVEITQEYLGQDVHLAFLGPLFKECLESDTFADGPGSTVARVVDGSLDRHTLTAIAGVANTGSDRNWCGHPFAAANWYAFGRLAWDHELTAESIAGEWVRMTFSCDRRIVRPLVSMMLSSRQAVVNYMTPLGLHHIMDRDPTHFGPGPWIGVGVQGWTTPYCFHRADTLGLGFDRTGTGSDAVSQYAPEVARKFGSIDDCPEDLLLWFHHVPWDRRMRSGRTLWDELCLRYQGGVDAVRAWERTWAGLKGLIDAERFERVRTLLAIQEREARAWRDASLLYFRQFSRMPLPPGCEPPGHTLDYYKANQPIRTRT
jgi:alpha-glucuronidase